MDYLEARRRLDTLENKRIGIGASLNEVSSAEATLGVTFPRSYIRFLVDCGWARLGSSDIFGIGQGVPHHLNMIELTVSERTEAYFKLAPHLIPLLDPGNGDLECLDLRRVRDGECPVVYRSHATGDVDQELAPDFSSWLGDLVIAVRENS